MRIGAAFPSKYVKAGQLPEDGTPVRVTIAKVVTENVAGEGKPPENKPVLYFEKKKQGIVLNKTNADVIAKAFGDETDDWTGRQIMLYSTETTFQGKTMPCIRVRIEKAKPAARQVSAPASPPVPAPEEYDGGGGFDGDAQTMEDAIANDEVPF